MQTVRKDVVHSSKLRSSIVNPANDVMRERKKIFVSKITVVITSRVESYFGRCNLFEERESIEAALLFGMHL